MVNNKLIGASRYLGNNMGKEFINKAIDFRAFLNCEEIEYLNNNNFNSGFMTNRSLSLAVENPSRYRNNGVTNTYATLCRTKQFLVERYRII